MYYSGSQGDCKCVYKGILDQCVVKVKLSANERGYSLQTHEVQTEMHNL